MSSSESSPRRAERWGWPLLLLPLGLFVIARSFDPDAFHHDVGWILYCAGEMLDGAVLYRDLIDENPPLVFWLSLPAVAIARALHLAPILVWNLGVFLAVAAAATLCRGFSVPAREDQAALGDGFAFALCGGLAALLVLLPGIDFGQREHLFSALVLPYLFAAVRFLAGRPLEPRSGLAVGALAGLGIALKPYFAVLPFAVELALLLARRSGKSLQRAEPWAIAGVHVIYVASVLLFAPGYLAVVEMAMPVYNAYNVPPEFVNAATAAAAVAGLSALLLRRRSSEPPGRSVWLVACIAGLAVGYLQRKGWDYHFLPALVFSAAFFGHVVLSRLYAFPPGRSPHVPRSPALPIALLVTTAVGFLVSATWQSFGAGREGKTLNRVLSSLVAERAADKPILVLSSSVNPSFPVVNLSGARWAHRFCCMWVLPAVYTDEEKAQTPFPYHTREQMSGLERFALDALVEDMASAMPVLLIVDMGRSKFAFGRTAFNYLEYFHRDPRFARMLREYRFLGDIGVFRVYERRSPGGGEPTS